MTIYRRSPSLAAASRRSIDVIVVVAVAPLLVPLVLLLALIVKLDSPGPAFWSHSRVGRGGKTFKMLKLRTMGADAEQRKAALKHLNVLEWPDFKIPNDPRVTRVGRWLRKTSLDELPQFWNVLRGDMTLVGPRPCSVPVSDYKLWQTERLEATPGLFGRWQACGRNRADFDKRCRMDIAQLRSQSMRDAVRDAVGTVLALMRTREEF